MTTDEIVTALDEEIRLLERAKALLSEAEPATRRRGRPKGSTNKQTSSSEPPSKPRPNLSASARERIAAAQRARWAKLKGTAQPKKKNVGTNRAGKRSASPRTAAAKKPAAAAEITA